MIVKIQSDVMWQIILFILKSIKITILDFQIQTHPTQYLKHFLDTK